jgi:hypothetical protein
MEIPLRKNVEFRPQLTLAFDPARDEVGRSRIKNIRTQGIYEKLSLRESRSLDALENGGRRR